MDCPFCRIPEAKRLLENEHFLAIRDIHPVSRGHCLVLAKRHVADFFALNAEEMASLHSICLQLRELLEAEYHPEGFNLAMNCGRAAGQSVFHFHLHFIPRYKQDKKHFHVLREFVGRALPG